VEIEDEKRKYFRFQQCSQQSTKLNEAITSTIGRGKRREGKGKRRKGKGGGEGGRYGLEDSGT